MAGLLTANMMRRHSPIVHERQAKLPNNHEALLRFRTNAVETATGIPFTKVSVTKAIFYNGQFVEPNLKVNNLYSYKVTGEYHNRSIIDTATVQRYVAPANFISMMAKSCNIKYDSEMTLGAISGGDGEPIISTIPMPALMNIVGWRCEESYTATPIWSVWGTLNTPSSICQTIYYPSLDVPYYRASITMDKFIIEFKCDPRSVIEGRTTGYDQAAVSTAPYVEECLDNFGISGGFKDINVQLQPYGKLVSNNPAEARRFVMAMTDQFSIYSVGRFATWRQILLDDVVHDINLVDGWITDRDAYRIRLYQ